MLLEVDHVAKHYPAPDGESQISILSDISFKTDSGNSLAIIGPSGSGKSTLLNLIGTLDRPSSGKISLNGTELTKVKQGELAAIRNQQIGFVFQQHHLLPQCTVLENVLLPTLPNPHKETATSRAKKLLNRVGLEDRLHHRPGQLSGGECQRVAVVRALINQPMLVLADEPTGALDASTAERLGELLVDVNKELGTVLIVVTHSSKLAENMHRHYELRNGYLMG